MLNYEDGEADRRIVEKEINKTNHKFLCKPIKFLNFTFFISVTFSREMNLIQYSAFFILDEYFDLFVHVFYLTLGDASNHSR